MIKENVALRLGAEIVQLCLNAANAYRAKDPGNAYLLDDLLKYVLKTVLEQVTEGIKLVQGRVMGIALHSWLQVDTSDDDRNHFTWIIDFGAPGAVPRPLLLMPDSPLQKAYLAHKI